jgi:hypothetical protein
MIYIQLVNVFYPLAMARQGSKLTYVRQSVTDKNPGGHIDFFTYQSDLANSDWSMYFKIFGEKKQTKSKNVLFSYL